jgi:phosphoribosylanthranilate isomerase
MQPSTKFKNLIEYTTIAATTAKEIANTTNTPFLGSTAALTLSIVKCVEVSPQEYIHKWLEKNFEQRVHLNKDECFEMVAQIHEIICTIVKLYSVSETQGILPTVLLYDIANFTE